jgi:hypothetical protein
MSGKAIGLSFKWSNSGFLTLKLFDAEKKFYDTGTCSKKEAVIAGGCFRSKMSIG